MEQTHYDIYFTGELVEGVNNDQAKMGLAQLFKTSVLKINKLFNGKPQLIKRNVNKTEAIKYKSALHKIGLLVAVKAHNPLTNKATNASTTEKTNNQQQPKNLHETTSLSLAPVGEAVLSASERSTYTSANIDTSSIKLVSPFTEITTAEPPSLPVPNTAHISIADLGEDLVEPHDSDSPAPLDLDHYSLAPIGVELENLANHTTDLNPDTSNISLAEIGGDLPTLKIDESEPVVPDISHLSLKP